jgi:uncharacterized membrane protein
LRGSISTQNKTRTPITGQSHPPFALRLGGFISRFQAKKIKLLLYQLAAMTDYYHSQIILAAILILATMVTLLNQIRVLPAQNVFAATVVILLISGSVQIISAKARFPFGQYFYLPRLGPELFHRAPWPVPLIWVVIIFNTRSVAKLILIPRRKNANAGLWLLALAVFLAIIFDVNLEPFASRANHLWAWRSVDNIPTWYGAPWKHFFAFGATALVILFAITPWMINKKLEREPPDYYALAIWVVLGFYLTGGNASYHFNWAAGFGLAGTLIVALFAWRNSRGIFVIA